MEHFLPLLRNLAWASISGSYYIGTVLLQNDTTGMGPVVESARRDSVQVVRLLSTVVVAYPPSIRQSRAKQKRKRRGCNRLRCIREEGKANKD